MNPKSVTMIFDWLDHGAQSLLYQRINERVDQMFAGLVKEAVTLRDLPDSQAAKGIGYREFSLFCW